MPQRIKCIFVYLGIAPMSVMLQIQFFAVFLKHANRWFSQAQVHIKNKQIKYE
jgi:hypothetical protein